MSNDRPTEPGTQPVGLPVAPGPSENLLRRNVGILARRWRWIALGLVVGLAAGVLAALLIDEKPDTARYYKATNTLTIGSLDPDDPASGEATGNYSLAQAALLIQSQQLKDQVANALATSPDTVAEQVDATVRPNVNAIDVTAIATDADTAVELADRSADTLRVLAQLQAGNTAAAQRAELDEQRTSLQNQRDLITAQDEPDDTQQALTRAQELQQIEAGLADIDRQIDALPKGSGFTLTVLAPATPTRITAQGYNWRRTRNINARSELVDPYRNTNSAPDFDETDLSVEEPLSRTKRIALGAAAGLVLGLLTAFVIEAWDDRIRRRDQVEELTGLAVLTEIPRLPRDDVRNHHVAVADEPTGVAAERYRSARTAIEFALGDDPIERARVLLVTSPNPAEGKTTTAVNLAASFVDAGQRVLVVDADFRRPTVRRYLGPIPNLVTPDEPQQTRVEGITFVPGPTDVDKPEEAIAALLQTVTRFHDTYDLIVVDTPPILTTNDAVGLLAGVDAVVLVLRAGRTRPRTAARVAELLRGYRADTLGVVLNDVDRTEMNEYYGYGAGYHYGYTRSGSRNTE